MGKYAKTLSTNLRRLVPEKYPSQAAFAKAAGITQPQANLYIRGEAAPKLDNLEGMADALGVSVSALIGDEAPVSAPPRRPTSEEFAAFFIESCDLAPKRKRICLLALTAHPDLINTMHDTSLDTYFKLVEGSTPDNKKSSVR